MVFYTLLFKQNYTMFSLKNRLFLTFQFGSIWGILGVNNLKTVGSILFIFSMQMGEKEVSR